MARELRRRFWVETVLGATAGILALVTLISRQWIEVLFGADPDGGSGSLEWTVVAGLALVTVAAGVLARTEFRRTAAALR